MLYLSKSRDTFVLRCSCGCFNLSFFDRGIKLEGQVRCMVCGEEADWTNLREDLDRNTCCDHKHDHDQDQDQDAPHEAEIHVLHA
ncbi:MAG: hypothetical protein AAF495_20625 [Pseudomonadota bacterium]